ncbi:MAG TPA: hypothetical protein VGK30_09470 [Candidatus Binatia bacterium]
MKATRKGLPVDPDCLGGAEGKFADGPGIRTACYPGVEAKGGCATNDDAATMGTSIDDFVNGAVTDLDVGTTTLALDKCAASKQACVSKLVVALLRCYATAERKSLPVSAACLGKAHASFDGGAKPEHGCFARIEAKSACAAIVDDPAGTEMQADSFVSSVACALGPMELCLQPTPAATPSGGGATPATPGGPTPTAPLGTSHTTPSAAPTGAVRTPTPTRTPTPGATRTATPGATRTPTPVRTPPPAVCGNGIVEDGEDCDGTNLDGFTCDDFCVGATGTLTCTSDCFLTVASCNGVGCEDP